MATRRRVSSESSSYSGSSGTSYFGYGSSGLSDEDDATTTGTNFTPLKRPGQSRHTFFDDVKVILSRHDTKLSKVEDDLACVVRWLNEKFDFILRYESASSIPSMWEEHDDRPDNATSISPSALGNDSFPDDYDNETLDSIENQSNDFNDCPSDDEVSSQAPSQLETEPKPVSLPVQPPPEQVDPQPITESPPEISNPRASQCDTCGKFLKDQSSLRQHKKIHLNIRPFTCTEPNCGKSFRRKFHLQTHSLIHAGVKDHQCGYCGRCFLLQKDLITHERTHTGEKPFNCLECPKSFNLKSHLVMHVRTHKGEKNYKCDICDKAFAQANTLRVHKKKVHQEKKEKVARKKKEPQTKKKEGTNSKSIFPPGSPMPAKLPLYRNQLTPFSTIPSGSTITPVTILQQPIITNHPIEFIESSDNNHSFINTSENIVLTESTINMLSALPSSSAGVATTLPLITSEIISIPQHILIPKK